MLQARSGGDNEFGGARPTTKFRELVQMALEQSDNDIHGASRTLLEWVSIDPATSELVWTELVPRALLQACRDEVRDQRSRIAENYVKERYSNQQSSPEAGENKRRLKAGARLMFMEWPLPDGRRLGKVRGDELHGAIRQYDEQTREMSRRARWLRAIAQRAGSKVVGQAMGEEDLRQLWNDC
jgi:hypothetical protein